MFGDRLISPGSDGAQPFHRFSSQGSPDGCGTDYYHWFIHHFHLLKTQSWTIPKYQSATPMKVKVFDCCWKSKMGIIWCIDSQTMQCEIMQKLKISEMANFTYFPLTFLITLCKWPKKTRFFYMSLPCIWVATSKSQVIGRNTKIKLTILRLCSKK